MDPACCAALLDVASPALPPLLVGSLKRWDQLDDEQQDRARGDLELMAAIMRTRLRWPRRRDQAVCGKVRAAAQYAKLR